MSFPVALGGVRAAVAFLDLLDLGTSSGEGCGSSCRLVPLIEAGIAQLQKQNILNFDSICERSATGLKCRVIYDVPKMTSERNNLNPGAHQTAFFLILHDRRPWQIAVLAHQPSRLVWWARLPSCLQGTTISSAWQRGDSLPGPGGL